jgi:hypothetical protein
VDATPSDRNHSPELRLLRWHQVDLLEGIILVGKSKTQSGEGRLVYLTCKFLGVLVGSEGLEPPTSCL